MDELNILTLKSDGRKGIKIKKEKYHLMRSFILEKCNSSMAVTFQGLIEEAKASFHSQFPEEEITWLLMNVKADLEGRGILKKRWEFGRVQVLSVKKNRVSEYAAKLKRRVPTTPKAADNNGRYLA